LHRQGPAHSVRVGRLFCSEKRKSGKAASDLVDASRAARAVDAPDAGDDRFELASSGDFEHEWAQRLRRKAPISVKIWRNRGRAPAAPNLCRSRRWRSDPRSSKHHIRQRTSEDRCLAIFFRALRKLRDSFSSGRFFISLDSSLSFVLIIWRTLCLAWAGLTTLSQSRCRTVALRGS